MRFVTKFWLCIGAVIIGYCATVALDAGLALANEERLATATAALFPATISCQEARHAFEQQLKLYEDGVLDGEPGPILRAATSASQVTALLAEVAALPRLGAEVQAGMAELGRRHQAFTSAAAELYPRMLDPRTAAAVQARAATLRQEAGAIRDALTARRDAMAAGLHQGLNGAAQAMRQQRIAGITAFLIIVSCSLVVVGLVMLGWSRRLGALLKASDQLAGGDAAAVLPAGRDDELGRLTASFAAMRDAVQARAQELRQFNEGLEETVRSRTGELAGKNAALRSEIAERERVELTLRLFEAAINQSSEAVIVSTPGATPAEARIVHVNPAFVRATGWQETEADGQPLAVLAGPATDGAVFAGLFATAAAGAEAAAELVCRRRDGGEYPGEWLVSPIRSADGRIHNLVAIHRDITERKRAQSELERANRQAGMAEIATGVLHNVGNVLNSVNVSAGLLVERLGNPRLGNLGRIARLLTDGAAVPDFLRADQRGRQLPAYLAQLAEVIDQEHAAMQAEARNLVTAVDHIKAIVGMQQSYATAGNVLAPERLVDVCEDALRLHQAALTRDAVGVQREYADLPAMALDRHKILQILVNLVANARQAIVAAAPAERRLTIGLGRAGSGRVRVWVADNGVGIPAGNLARIFSHGFTTKRQGHGFGLHRCANAATEMGGTLTASSPGPGLGARFELELPITRTSA